MDEPSPFDSRYTRYQLRRSRLRKLVRRAYLHHAAKQLVGPTLDFGCGIGELLARLPSGSRGLEYNRESVAYCRRNGLLADFYDGTADNWALGGVVAPGQFQSMVISHVLEHLDDPVAVLRHLLQACDRVGITRVLVIVPGTAGFKTDPTHKVFVDDRLLSEGNIEMPPKWARGSAHYFPIDMHWLGLHFAHHEMHVMFKKSADSLPQQAQI